MRKPKLERADTRFTSRVYTIEYPVILTRWELGIGVLSCGFIFWFLKGSGLGDIWGCKFWLPPLYFLVFVTSLTIGHKKHPYGDLKQLIDGFLARKHISARGQDDMWKPADHRLYIDRISDWEK